MSEWACNCNEGYGHVDQYAVEVLPGVYAPALCFRHKKHVPCRKCYREEDMTPQEVFAEIAFYMNKLLEFEQDHDFGVNVEAHPFPTYLLGAWDEDAGTYDVASYIRYNPEEERYEVHEGDVRD